MYKMFICCKLDRFLYDIAMTETEKKKLRRARDILNEVLGETQASLGLDVEETPKAEKKTQYGKLHSDMVRLFNDWYLQSFGTKFIWNGKETTGTQRLRSAIIQIAKDRGVILDEPKILDAYRIILAKLKESDEFVYNNATPSLIHSKINAIYARMSAGSTEDYDIDQRLK